MKNWNAAQLYLLLTTTINYASRCPRIIPRQIADIFWVNPIIVRFIPRRHLQVKEREPGPVLPNNLSQVTILIARLY